MTKTIIDYEPEQAAMRWIEQHAGACEAMRQSLVFHGLSDEAVKGERYDHWWYNMQWRLW